MLKAGDSDASRSAGRYFVEFDWKQVRVRLEVAVGRENRHGKTCGDGANQEVGVGALNTSSAASIVEERRCFVVRLVNRQVRKRSQSISHGFKLKSFPDPGQEFLADRPNQERPFLPDQRGKL